MWSLLMSALRSNAEKQQQRERDADRLEKIEAGHRALSEAASLTKEVAQEVQSRLQEKSTISPTTRALVDSLIICSPTGVIEVFNPAAERMFGITQIAAIGMNIADILVDVTNGPVTVARLEQLVGDGTQHYLRGRCCNKNSLFAICVTVSHILRADGSIDLLLIVKNLEAPQVICKTG